MTNSQIRERARESLRGKWPLAIGISALAGLLGGPGTSFLPDINISGLTEILDGPIFEYGNFRITTQLGILGILTLILGGGLELGHCKFYLKSHDGQDPEFGDLFSLFDRFGDGFAQHFLRGLYVFLWSLLFIIPGIIKEYSYAMTPYIMIDHPELSASEAITASKEMMDGHKGELLMLHLSFIGWNILAALSFNLGNLVLNPYKTAATATFYRQLTNAEHNPY